MIIAVDFDGTCVTHEYPRVGTELPLCVDTLRALAKVGHQLILYTMRSGPELSDAVEWCAARNIPLWGINENPEQHTWTKSPKVYAGLYIDDAALGCPMTRYKDGQRPQVDWNAVLFNLRMQGLIPDDIEEAP